MARASRDVPESQELPHVTDVIELVRDMRWIPESALERGRFVHKACAFLDGWEGSLGLDFDTLHPVLLPYVQGYQAWLDLRRPVFIAIEQPVVCWRYKYQGRLDRVTDEEIWDIKCGPNVHPAEGLQTSAYMRAYGQKVRRRYSLHLIPGRNPPFKVEEWKDRADFPVFLGLLNAHQWRIKHGLYRESNSRS